MSDRFYGLFTAMQGDPEALEAARKAGIVVQFHFFAPPSFIVLDMTVSPFAVSREENEKPGVEIGLTVETADGILSGKLALLDAVRSSAVRVHGGVLQLLALQRFMDAARTAYGRMPG